MYQQQREIKTSFIVLKGYFDGIVLKQLSNGMIHGYCAPIVDKSTELTRTTEAQTYETISMLEILQDNFTTSDNAVAISSDRVRRVPTR